MLKRRLMVIAGEVSGDMRAAEVIRALRARHPGVECFGIGGPDMRAVGVETVRDVREMAVLGLSEVVRRYPFFRRVFSQMTALAKARRPDAVLLVDYPGFNLRFARVAKKLGIRVVYYICPQVWAWHRERIPAMAKIIDRLITVFPFEPPLFAGTGLRVDYVGHPLVDAARQALAEPLAALPWPARRRVAILPGSRRQEIERILPPLARAARLLEEKNENVGFIVAAPSEDVARWARNRLAQLKAQPARCAIVVGQTRQVLRQAHAAFVASGTATLEAALLHCPMLVVYKAAAPTYAIGRLVVRGVKHLGMVNVLAGRGICPEFIQGAMQPRALADAMARLLDDTACRGEMVRDLRAVSESLGAGGAAGRAAAIVEEELVAGS